MSLRKIVILATLVVFVFTMAAMAQMSKANKPMAQKSTMEKAPNSSKTKMPVDIIQTLKEKGTYTKTVMALEMAGMTPQLKANGPHTLFAPTDMAWNAVPKTDYDALFNDKAKLTDFMKHFIVESKLTTAELNRDTTTTVGMKDHGTEKVVKINSMMGMYQIPKMYVEARSFNCTNGIVYPMSSIMMPMPMGNMMPESNTPMTH
jgi:uncharacterized surface protein with fasciclin (FAS1) repeats